MRFKENLVSSVTIVMFVAMVIFYDFDPKPVEYDCNKLHQYKDLPEEVMHECIKILKPNKHIIVT